MRINASLLFIYLLVSAFYCACGSSEDAFVGTWVEKSDSFSVIEIYKAGDGYVLDIDWETKTGVLQDGGLLVGNEKMTMDFVRMELVFRGDRYIQVEDGSVEYDPNPDGDAVPSDLELSSPSPTMLPGRFPQASARELKASDLAHLSKRDLKIMRNEIFARHGLIFKTADMKAYFAEQSWYHGQYEDVNAKLSKIERSNIRLIKGYE